MFARISGSMASDLIDESPSSYPANAWIWSEQTIAAQRRRIGCPPFQSPSKSSSSSGQHHHRGALMVCWASSSRRHKAAHAPVRRPPRWRNAAKGYLHTGLYSAGSSSSSSSSLLHSMPMKQQQQQQASVNPDALTACIEAAVHYHELEALCNTFLHNASFSIKHAALVLSRLHKVHRRKQDSQLLLVELLAAKLQSSFSAAAAASSCQQPQLLSPTEVAEVCWSFAEVGYQPHAGLLQPLLQQFWSGFDQQQGKSQQQGSTCYHAILSQLAAGLAGLGFRDPAVWARFRATVVDSVHKLQPACLQQLVWAFTTAQVSDAATTGALANAVLQRIDQFEAEELAQVVWCFHVLGYDSSELYQQAAQQMVVQVEAAAGRCGSIVKCSSSKQAGSKSKAEDADVAQQQTQSVDATVAHTAADRTGNVRQQQQQQQQQQPPMQRPRLPCLQQNIPNHQHIALRLPHTVQQQHSSRTHCSSNRQQSSAARGSLGRTAADLYSAAASQAYSVLEKYDPLLCTLALYRDYFQPA